jgi:hypothetical protein
MGWYSKAHYRRLSNGGPDTSAQVTERVRRATASKQANAEMLAKFSPLTAENAQAAVDWQEARIKELLRTK